MPQDEKEDGFWSKADSYQPKTPAMKSWKANYLKGTVVYDSLQTHYFG